MKPGRTPRNDDPMPGSRSAPIIERAPLPIVEVQGSTHFVSHVNSPTLLDAAMWPLPKAPETGQMRPAMKKKTHPAISPTLPQSTTGITGLDEITGGGLPAGRPTLVCGGAGCGKAMLAMEFSSQS